MQQHDVDWTAMQSSRAMGEIGRKGDGRTARTLPRQVARGKNDTKPPENDRFSAKSELPAAGFCWPGDARASLVDRKIAGGCS